MAAIQRRVNHQNRTFSRWYQTIWNKSFKTRNFWNFGKCEILHQPNSYFRKQINENKQILLKNRNKFQTFKASSINLLLICRNLSWSNVISRTRKIFQIASLQFEEFWRSKTEILEFQLNCSRGGSSKSTLNLKQFHFPKFQNNWNTFDKTK